MKRVSLLLVATTLVLWLPNSATAVPTQYGDTGLLSQPTADTLNAGNICVGLWANHASGDTTDATIVPVSLTLGLGSFLEAYGSYPNLLFNDDELDSGRGFANVGFKLRIFGKRSSPFKLALDGQARRTISDNPDFDGLTDYVGRVIASFKPGRFGIHANAAYVSTEAPEGTDYDNQYVVGGGIEIYPAARLRLIAEMEAVTEKQSGLDGPQEATVGVQYFISPHLTVNLGVGMGLSDASPDWRILFGFSSCQGIGTYTRPIPKIVEPVAEQAEEKKEPVKVVKVRTLTPLIAKTAAVEPSPVSNLEIPVEPGKEEVILQPSERLNIPGTEVLGALPIAPVGATSVVEAVTTTSDSAAIAGAPQGAPATPAGVPDAGTEGKVARLKPISRLKPAAKVTAPETAPVAATPQEITEKAASVADGDAMMPSASMVATTPEATAMAVAPQGSPSAVAGAPDAATEGKITRLKPISRLKPYAVATTPEPAPVATTPEPAEKTATVANGDAMMPPVSAVATTPETTAMTVAPQGSPSALAGAPAAETEDMIALLKPTSRPTVAEKVPAPEIAPVAATTREAIEKTAVVANGDAVIKAASAVATQKATEEAGATVIDFRKPVSAVVYRKFRLPEFTFGYDQANLSEEGKKSISRIVDQLRKEGKWFVVRVDGHTDSIGSDTYNQSLSLNRAISAATHMVLRDGFDPNRMFVKGYGETEPIASNITPEGRAENRRIELLVLVPKEAGK